MFLSSGFKHSFSIILQACADEVCKLVTLKGWLHCVGRKIDVGLTLIENQMTDFSLYRQHTGLFLNFFL